MTRIKLFGLSIFILLIMAYSCFYLIQEGQSGLLLRLGKIELSDSGKPLVQLPGLHVKLPIIYQAKVFDTRLHTWDIQSSRIVTAEQKDVIVDYYFKWRIQDLALYFTRTGGNPQQAEILLEQGLNDSLRAEFGRRTISEVISDDRSEIMDKLREQANLSAKTLGLKVIDVRIKRIDLPSEVSAAVFQRMRAERERIAAEHRAQGKADAEAIRATADKNVAVLVATAKSDAARIRGDGDASAAAIYADAYNRDANFSSFYQSLQAYKKVFASKNDVFVLKPNSQFFKYFSGVIDTSSNEKRLAH